MALPKLTTPTYELEIPSTDEKIKFRPFLVKEEKILMMAMESKSSADITQAVKDIVTECTFNKVTIDNMPMFDVEYIFLQIRAKSVGEVSKLKLLCPDDKKTYADVELDLNEVKVQVGEDHTNKIELDNGMGIIMTYPTIDSFRDSGIRDINASNMLEVISGCILQIYEKNGEKTYDPKDQTKKELTEFIEQLNTKQFKQVQKFFETMPKLKHEITIKNPKTKKESKVTLTGLNDFFG
ncbi:MAG: baseplate protein [Formosa sp.]|nr:baseplate protein [Formosa sp.]